jgi:hypothetical protein
VKLVEEGEGDRKKTYLVPLREAMEGVKFPRPTQIELSPKIQTAPAKVLPEELAPNDLVLAVFKKKPPRRTR